MEDITRTDVLVVGGGFAGVLAALAAAEQGAATTIVSLGPVGRSGNTVVAGGVISGATPDAGNTAEAFLRDLQDSAQGIADPQLLAHLAGESEEALLYMEKLGVPLRRQDNGFVRVLSPGHSLPRTVLTDWSQVPFAARGRTFLEPVARRAAAQGIAFHNGLRAINLTRHNGRVTGLTAYSRKTGKPHRFAAGSVVLATGGFGGLFQQHNNVADIFGDGIALGLEAGCVLRDMEFVQFYPLMMFKPIKSTIPGFLFTSGAVLRNADAERFMDRYDPAGDGARRDAMARAIWLEAQAGRTMDGAVYADCTQVPRERLEEEYGAYYAILLRNGIDLHTDWITGKPAVHYTLGGIRIDADGRTGVPGLFAAGEVTGGVHGVNRLAGCALMEAAIFGRRAGRAAAAEACAPDLRTPDPDVRELSPEAHTMPEAYTVPENMEDAFRTLRQVMWDKVSLLRDEAGLTEALHTVRALQAAWDNAPSLPGRAFARTLRVAEAVIRSAQMRTESRGAHYRMDFPEKSTAWTKPVYASLRQGSLIVESPDPAA